jgi:hypothetical protein
MRAPGEGHPGRQSFTVNLPTIHCQPVPLELILVDVQKLRRVVSGNTVGNFLKTRLVGSAKNNLAGFMVAAAIAGHNTSGPHFSIPC